MDGDELIVKVCHPERRIENSTVTRIRAETRMTPIRVIRVSALICVTLLFLSGLTEPTGASYIWGETAVADMNVALESR